MKTIGVISDTHGTLDVRAYNSLADCDVIIHAGDICGPEILRELETLAPVHAVLGNNDYPEYGDDVQRYAKFEIDGISFLVAHRPNSVDVKKLGSVLGPGEKIPKVRIHGHTHVPRLVTGPKASPSELLMNPGSLKRPRSEHGCTLGKIKVNDGKIVRVWIEKLDGDVVFERKFNTASKLKSFIKKALK